MHLPRPQGEARTLPQAHHAPNVGHHWDGPGPGWLNVVRPKSQNVTNLIYFQARLRALCWTLHCPPSQRKIRPFEALPAGETLGRMAGIWTTIDSNIEAHVTVELAEEIVECCRLYPLMLTPLTCGQICSWQVCCDFLTTSLVFGQYQVAYSSCKAATDSGTNKASRFTRKVTDTMLIFYDEYLWVQVNNRPGKCEFTLWTRICSPKYMAFSCTSASIIHNDVQVPPIPSCAV